MSCAVQHASLYFLPLVSKQCSITTSQQKAGW